MNGAGVLATCNVPLFVNGAFGGHLPSCDYYNVLAQ